MNTIERLAWLQAHACSLSIEVNDFRNYYDPIEKAVADQDEGDFFTDDEVKAECLKRGQLVWLQCYPHTPIGFIRIVHYDVTTAIDLAYARIAPELQPTPNRSKE